MRQTTHYNWDVPEGTDYASIEPIAETLDAIDEEMSKKSEFSGNYNDLENKPYIPDTSSLATKDEVDSEKAARQTADSNLQTAINAKYTASNASVSARGLVKYAQGTFSISANGFTADTTYEDYPFRKAIAVSGCTANHFADVCFDIASATGGKIAPVVQTYSGGFYVYAKEQNASQITGTYKVTYNA